MTSARVSDPADARRLGHHQRRRHPAIRAGDLVQQYCLACQFDHYNAERRRRSRSAATRSTSTTRFRPAMLRRRSIADRTSPATITTRCTRRSGRGYAQLTWNGELLGPPRQPRRRRALREHQGRPRPRIVAQPDRDRLGSRTTISRRVDLEQQSSTIVAAANTTICCRRSISGSSRCDNVVVRVSYSKTIARPDYDNLFASRRRANAPNRPTAHRRRPTGDIGQSRPAAAGLGQFRRLARMVFRADRAIVSAGFFHKRVRNFVGIGQDNRSLFGLRDPSSGAAGTRSGAAPDGAATALGADISDVNLFTMTALIDPERRQRRRRHGAVQRQFMPGGALNQAFVDYGAGAVRHHRRRDRSAVQVLGRRADQQPRGQYPRLRAVRASISSAIPASASPAPTPRSTAT